MTKEQVGEIVDRIEAIYLKKFTDLQAEEWLDSFEKEDYGVALRAFKIMKDGGYGMSSWGFPPTPSVFWNYINRIKEIDESAQKKSGTPKLGEPTPQDLNRHLRWMRFISWTYETGRFPKTSEEAFTMKVRFEKEHPNWKRKEMVVTNKPETIGQILK